MPQSGSTDNEAATSIETADELIRYGLAEIPIDCFNIGEYRHTDLRLSIAPAKHMVAET